MPSQALPCIGALAVVLLHAAPPALAQDTAITGARVTLIEKPAGALAITLQNLRDAPLVAWELAVVRPGVPGPENVTATDVTRPFPYAADNGPLNLNELRVLRIQANSLATGSSVVVRFAVFADGYYEGERGSAEKYRQRRAWQAHDVRFWLGALQPMPRSDDEGLRKFLRDQLARHAARRDARQSIEAGHLRSLAFDDVPPGPEWMGDQVNSVAAGTTGTPQGRFYAVVENLTDVPMEAFGLDYASGTFMRSDLYSAAEARPGFGPIEPRERRDVPVSLGHGDNPERPDVTLSFVLFADLRFEGSREQRDRCTRASAAPRS